MLTAVAFGVTLLSTSAFAQDSKPAYLVASLSVSNLQKYMGEYGAPVFPMLAKAGAEVLVGTPKVNALEGDYGATWTAIVKFPSMEALQTWYKSEEYQAVAPKRRSLSGEDSFLFAAPQFKMPSQ
jgi:uncharacterized protein (DUF1330 family)